MELIFPHKLIKNTATDGMILIEHQLNTSRGYLSPKSTRMMTT